MVWLEANESECNKEPATKCNSEKNDGVVHTQTCSDVRDLATCLNLAQILRVTTLKDTIAENTILEPLSLKPLTVS